jgi:hypothetical protein
MDQLGAAIRFTAAVDRRLVIEGTRFALRTLPAQRRVAWTSAVFAGLVATLAALATQQGLDDGKPLGSAMSAVAPLWIGAVAAIVLRSSRVRARLLASQVRDSPEAADVAYRFDADGYEARDAGTATRLEWPIVTAAGEGDRFIALGAGRRRFMVCPAERLSEAERATIRRWAEAAPGDRTWQVRRPARANARLRVTTSPSDGPAPGAD